MTYKMTRKQVEEAIAAAHAKNKWPDLRGSNLSDLDLTDLDLSSADLADANLHGAHLNRANLRGACLSGADLSSAYLIGADLHDADLTFAKARHADMRYVDLRGADLYDTDLRSANLHGAHLLSVDLRYSNTTAANLTGLFLGGLPSGNLVFIPTTEGWHLTIGCWEGTTDELREMIAKDEDWPEAEGEEITERRPMLEAAADMCEAYAASKPHALMDVKYAADRWKENR